MAEGGSDLFSLSVQKLDEELTCPVCHEHFEEPKVLPCLHCYCKNCVAALISRTPRGQPINCPECRRNVQVEGNDPESLPTAFFVNRMEAVFSVMKKAEKKEEIKCETCSRQTSIAIAFCKNCRHYVCERCAESHKFMSMFSGHEVVSISSLLTHFKKSGASRDPIESQELKCHKHTNESFKLYCYTCHQLVCRDCTLVDHKDHKYAFIVDAAPQCKSAIKEKVESLQNLSCGLKTASKLLTDSEKKLKDHSAATVKAIDDAHNRIVLKLQQKSKELKATTAKMINSSQEEIASQKKNIDLAMGEVDSLYDFLSRNLERATDQELFSLLKQMSDQAKRAAHLYANPPAKFPVPTLPQLEVHCSNHVLQVLQEEFFVSKVPISLVLSPEDFDFFEQIKRSEISDSIKCQFNHDTFQIFLEVPSSEVSKLKESIEIFLQHTDIPVTLDPLTTEFFRTDAGKSKLKKFLEEMQCQAALHFSVHPNLTLHLLCRNEDARSARAVMQAIPLVVRAKAIPIPDSVAPVLSELDDFKQLCQKLEKENCVLIKNVGHEISAAGFKPEVSKSLAEINRFLKEKASPLPPSEMKIGVLVAKSLQSNQRNVEKCLHSLHVQLQIDTSRGVLQFSPLHFLMPGWEEACKTTVNEYLLSNVAEAKVHVPQNAYQDIMRILYSMQSEDPTFILYYPPQSTNLTFAGDKNTVKAAEDKLAQICANFSFKSEEISLKQEDFEFLNLLKMEELIAKCRPLNIDIESNPESHSLTLAGPAKGLKTAKENVASMTAHVTVPVSLEEPVVKFFTTERGKDKLYNILRDSRYGKCAPFISDSPMKLLLLCSTKHKRNAEKASDALRMTTTASPLQIPDLLSPFLAELPEFVKRVQSLEEKNSVQISVEDKEMLVAGFEDGVTASIDALSTFVKKIIIHFLPLHVPVDTMIAECIEDNPVGLIACLVNIPVNHKIKSGKSSASISLSPTPKTKYGWKEECESILTSFLEKHYLRTEIEVPKTAADEVFQVFMTASRKKDFKFELCDDGSRAIVAGEISEVRAVEGKVASICTKHQTTEEIQLTDREYDFFTQLVQPKIKNITIECNPAKHAIVVAGSIREITDLTKSVKKMVAHSVVPVSADAFLINFFTTSGKQEITAYVNQKMLNVAFHSRISAHSPVLELLCEPKFEASVRELAEKLPENCQISTVSLRKPMITLPMDKKFTSYCQQLEIHYHVSITIKRHEVKLCGFRGPVMKAKECIESFIKTKYTTKETFPVLR